MNLSNGKRKTTNIIFKQIVYGFEEIYNDENLNRQVQSNYQNFSFIETHKFEKPTIGFFIGASSTSKS